MIQSGTYLNTIDNSGAKKVYCIKVLGGYRRRYANIGDTILVSIKSLRLKRRKSVKVKKGDKVKAIIIRTKFPYKVFSGESIQFAENAVALLNKQNKFIGTRVFGGVPKLFRHTKFLKLLSLSAGIIY